MDYKKVLEKVKENLIKEYNPLAIGIFGSGARKITPTSDVDMYVLKDLFFRIVKRSYGLIFEIYFAEPRIISEDITSRNVNIINRFRNSRAIYDPNKIYSNLIKQAKKQKLIEETWREKTIIGGDYDLVERTSISVEKSLREGKLESAVASLQFLFGRIIDLGFKRLNISDYSQPRKIPDLISRLPKETEILYKMIMFSDIREKDKIREIMGQIEKNREKLLPLT